MTGGRAPISDLGWRLARAGWRAGSCSAHTGPVVVSLTDFTFARWRDLPGAWLAAMRLRRAWPRLPGAVGLMLWVMPFSRRSGSISIWTSDADLRRFVSWRAHAAIVRRYRSRMSGAHVTWLSDSPAVDAAAAEGRGRVSAAA